MPHYAVRLRYALQNPAFTGPGRKPGMSVRFRDYLSIKPTPTPAPKIGEMTIQVGPVSEDVRLASTRLMRGINVLGIPSLAMPCGFTRTNLPIGLQILAAPRQEDTLLTIGAALEDALGLGGKHPAGF